MEVKKNKKIEKLLYISFAICILVICIPNAYIKKYVLNNPHSIINEK